VSAWPSGLSGNSADGISAAILGLANINDSGIEAGAGIHSRRVLIRTAGFMPDL
jgi:hypothetical protein